MALAQIDWNETRVGELTNAWMARSSATQIAVMFTENGYPCNRNMVIGKLSRMGLLKTRPKPPPNPAKPRRIRRRSPPKLSKAILEQFEQRAAQVKAMAPLHTPNDQLTPYQCRWPLGETDDRCQPTYCGHPASDPGRPWCQHHIGLIYEKPKRRTSRPMSLALAYAR